MTSFEGILEVTLEIFQETKWEDMIIVYSFENITIASEKLDNGVFSDAPPNF